MNDRRRMNDRRGLSDGILFGDAQRSQRGEDAFRLADVESRA
jgi:hypothetical protein